MIEALKLLKISPNLLTNNQKEKLNSLIKDIFNEFKPVEDINTFIEICIILFMRIINSKLNSSNELDFIKELYSEESLIKSNALKSFANKVWRGEKIVNSKSINAIKDFINKLNKMNLNITEQIALRKLCEIIFEIFSYPILNINPYEETDNNLDEIIKLCQAIILNNIPDNIDEKQAKAIYEIIYHHTLIYIVDKDSDLYRQAEFLLTKLKMNDEDKHKLEEAKKWQANNLKAYSPKNG